MSDYERQFCVMVLLPVVWVLLNIYVFRPLERAAAKHLPPTLSSILIKKRG